MSARRRTLLLLALAGGVEATFTLRAQLTAYDPTGARSYSGQFIVHVERSDRGFGREPDFYDAPDMLRLEAPLVATSCERLKQTLAAELADKSQWRGKIFVSLRPASGPDEEIGFTAERFRDNWAYRLDVPNPVPRTRYVRAIVQALLQERANRNARERSAEIPLWLSEGLTQMVLGSRSLEIILPPPTTPMNRLTVAPVVTQWWRTNTATAARQSLGDRGPMSLDELSWPRENQLSGPERDRYSRSAELFIAELLRLKGGRDCLRATFDELANFLNWQTAFLRAFQPHFQRQLDVEKWWELQIMNSTGRDLRALWSPTESWSKLEEIVRVPTQVRRTKADLPESAFASLSTVVREWDFAKQSQVLRPKVADLALARQRVADEFLPLVDEYRRVLENYLANRGKNGITLGADRGSRPSAKAFAREIAGQLEALDARREKLRPAAATSSAQSNSVVVRP